jgi:hypothetical protein
MSEVTEQQLEDIEALFVQTAASMTSDRGTITLHGLSPVSAAGMHRRARRRMRR